MSLTVTSAYAGEFKGFVDQLFNETEALNMNLFRTVQEKYKGNYGKIVPANISQIERDTPTDRGSMAVTDKVLTNSYFHYYVEFNPFKSTFREYWVPGVTTGAEFAALPPELQRPIVDKYTAAMGEHFNDCMFQGGTSLTEALPFTGLKANMLADSDVLDSASPTTISNSNALAELAEMRQRATAKMKKAAGFAYLVDYDWWEFLIEEQDATTATNLVGLSIRDTPTGPQIMYFGKPVYGLTGMEADSGYAGVFTNDDRGNFVTQWDGALNGHEIMIDRVQNNSNKWFLKVTMGADVDVIHGADAVLYGT